MVLNRTFEHVGFCGVVVITSALHAEGREFEPRQNLDSFYLILPSHSSVSWHDYGPEEIGKVSLLVFREYYY